MKTCSLTTEKQLKRAGVKVGYRTVSKGISRRKIGLPDVILNEEGLKPEKKADIRFGNDALPDVILNEEGLKRITLNPIDKVKLLAFLM